MLYSDFTSRYVTSWSTNLDLEPIAGHACLVLGDEVGALLLGIVGLREKHALVALSFLVGANAAWLEPSDTISFLFASKAYLVLCLRRSGVLEICAHVGGGWRCYPRINYLSRGDAPMAPSTYLKTLCGCVLWREGENCLEIRLGKTRANFWRRRCHPMPNRRLLAFPPPPSRCRD